MIIDSVLLHVAKQNNISNHKSNCEETGNYEQINHKSPHAGSFSYAAVASEHGHKVRQTVIRLKLV